MPDDLIQEWLADDLDCWFSGLTPDLEGSERDRGAEDPAARKRFRRLVEALDLGEWVRAGGEEPHESRILADRAGAHALQGLRLSGLGDRRDHLPRHSQLASPLVPGHVVSDGPEGRTSSVPLVRRVAAETGQALESEHAQLLLQCVEACLPLAHFARGAAPR